MLEQIVINPIETPRGYKNPNHGIALRGPLSQFFSGIYLKPLDDIFSTMDVTYLRYQDDVLVLCINRPQCGGGSRYCNESSNACAGSYRSAPKDAAKGARAG